MGRVLFPAPSAALPGLGLSHMSAVLRGNCSGRAWRRCRWPPPGGSPSATPNTHFTDQGADMLLSSDSWPVQNPARAWIVQAPARLTLW